MKAITSTFLERGNPELQDRLETLQFGDKAVFIVGPSGTITVHE